MPKITGWIHLPSCKHSAALGFVLRLVPRSHQRFPLDLLWKVHPTSIKQLFDGLYAEFNRRPNTSPADKEDVSAEVKEIQSTVTQAAQKNDKADEGFLSHRFRNISPRTLRGSGGRLVRAVMAGVGG